MDLSKLQSERSEDLDSMLQIRLPDDLKREFQEYCANQDRKVSQVLRQFMREAVNNDDFRS